MIYYRGFSKGVLLYFASTSLHIDLLKQLTIYVDVDQSAFTRPWRYRPISIHLPLKVSTNQRSVINDSYPFCRRSFQFMVNVNKVGYEKGCPCYNICLILNLCSRDCDENAALSDPTCTWTIVTSTLVKTNKLTFKLNQQVAVVVLWPFVFFLGFLTSIFMYNCQYQHSFFCRSITLTLFELKIIYNLFIIGEGVKKLLFTDMSSPVRKLKCSKVGVLLL